MVALDVEEALLQMEYRAWCGEVRHALSRLMSLGSPMVPRKASRTESYSLIRLDKCPLLWQIKGGTEEAFIQRKGESDVVLFPQMFARFEDSVAQLPSLDGITFVQLDLTTRLHLHPTSTLRELDALQITADKLKASREKLLEKLQNAGFEEFLSRIRADVSSKCHKLALIYVHTQLRSVSTANRQKAHHIVSRRRYDFSKWVEVKVQIQNEAVAAEQDRLKLLAAIPPPPPDSTDANVVIVLNWEGEKFLDAIKATHRSLTHGRAYEFAGRLQDQFVLSVANLTSFQRSKSVQAVSDDLKLKEVSELEVLTQSNAIESYIASLLPKQQRAIVPPPVSSKAPAKRVTFPPAFLQVKYFDKNCPPLDIATTEAVTERVPDTVNASQRGGPANAPRRTNLPTYDPVTRAKVARYS